jgi:hypothetical protein
MIGKMLVGFVIAVAVIFGGGALLSGQFNVPNNIFIYIIGGIFLMGVVNTFNGIINEGNRIDVSLGQQTEMLDVNLYNVPGVGAGFETGNGRKFVIRESKDKEMIAIHQVKNGKLERPLIVQRNQAAYHINRKARE